MHHNDFERKMFGGLIRVSVLHHAVERRIYGSWMMEVLMEGGFEIGPGTMYPLLHEMERDGYVKAEDELVNGRVRKYYRATPAGRRLLKRARERIREIVGEPGGGAR